MAEAASDQAHVDANGTIHVPAFTLPESALLSEATRSSLRDLRDRQKADALSWLDAETFYRSSLYRRVREQYDVAVVGERIAGVYTEVFTPAEGIAPKNQNRVLVNLHGGGFATGSRTISHLEAAPIASIGGIKVVSIDYRQAPACTFPAASEDVAAVYRDLLESYQPENIGIYGCSAGGLLTAQAIAWLQKERLPLPAAVGIFCAGARFWTEGDSGQIGAALKNAATLETAPDNLYLKGADPNDPLVFPARSPRLLAMFPPTLLIAATRDFALSAAVHTHSLLVAQGVDAALHVWEGLGHAFYFDPDLPEAREVHEVVVRFFDRHLGPVRQRLGSSSSSQVRGEA